MYTTKCNTVQNPALNSFFQSDTKLFPNSNASCGRCHNTPPNLTHMFWSRPALTTYWSMIFKSLLNALVINFKPNATTAIFGITVGEYSIYRKSRKSIIAFTTLLTCRRILLHWKSKHTTYSVNVVE